MKVAKVIGNIWATRKEARLNGLTLLIVQELDVSDGACTGAPFVAADVIGAGFGETVLVVGGSSARGAAGDMSIPVDAAVTAIIDNFELAPKERGNKNV